MLFFYLPMIIFRAMFGANADKRVDEFALERCACRKSNPDIFMMQPAEDWATKNTPSPLNSTR